MTAKGAISGDNQLIFDELSDAAKEKIPLEVYTQLSTGFVPAVKEVARAGSELLKIYQAFQKYSDQYVYALRLLVSSSDKAYPGAKAYGDGLKRLVTQYESALEQHRSCVTELTGIVSKTSMYSTEEKEKLKEMYSRYQKQEKELEKERKKGTKSTRDKTRFIDDSAKEFLRQQEMRYKFFFEKHRTWLSSYLNILPVVDTTHKDSVSNKSESLVNGPHILSDSDFIKKPNDEYNSFNAEAERGRKSVTEAFSDSAVEHTTKPASTSFVRTASEDRPPSNGTQTSAPISVAAQVPRDSSPADLSKESPILMQTPEQHYMPNEFTNNLADVQRRDYVMTQPIADHMEYRPDEPEITKRTNERRPPVGGRLVLPPIDNAASRPHYYVDSEFTSQAFASHRPTAQLPPKPTTSVPPIFSNCDYGRVLTVTQDFNATSGEQITVNRGNKVVLIKSGTRGWIFIKDAESQRTGWIPAPFVEY